jgi:hypothetical protein
MAELLAGKIEPGMIIKVDGRRLEVIRRYRPHRERKGSPTVMIGFDVRTKTGIAYGRVPDTYRFEVVSK